MGSIFYLVPNKEQAWLDLHRLTQDNDWHVRWRTAYSFGLSFVHIPDKEQAWADLHRFTLEEESVVRKETAKTIGSVFIHIPDKKQAWSDLIRLTQDEESWVRKKADGAVSSAFPYFPDKKQGWSDLHKLTVDEESQARRCVANALGSSFDRVTDKMQAMKDLLNLTYDKEDFVRWNAIEAIGPVFSYFPDKNKGWIYLQKLMLDEEYFIRMHAAKAVGLAFSYIPDKEQAWSDLHRLTQDKEGFVRGSANYSLGRISIIKATEAESEQNKKIELENAIEFFKRSSNEAFTYYIPSKFCFPFYQCFYSIVFNKQEVKAELRESIMKINIEDSEIKGKLIKILENMANILEETQKARDYNNKKIDHNTYKLYCERVADLLESTQGNAPLATRIIRGGIPIFDQRIKVIIAEIQENAKIACQESKDTPIEEIACTTSRIVKKWQISDQDLMTENVEDLIFTLKAKIPNIPKNRYIYDKIEEIGNETDLTKQYKKVANLIAIIPTIIIGELHMGDIEIFRDIQNTTIINKSIIENSFNKVKKEYNEEVAKALIRIAEFIEESGETSAGILYNKFIEELNKPQPDKNTIRNIWDGIEKTLPSIKALSEVIANLAPLF